MDSSSVIQNDVYCIECGYNLRMQLLDGVCPECRTPTKKSQLSTILLLNNLKQIRLLRCGLTIYGFAIALWLFNRFILYHFFWRIIDHIEGETERILYGIGQTFEFYAPDIPEFLAMIAFFFVAWQSRKYRLIPFLALLLSSFQIMHMLLYMLKDTDSTDERFSSVIRVIEDINYFGHSLIPALTFVWLSRLVSPSTTGIQKLIRGSTIFALAYFGLGVLAILIRAFNIQYQILYLLDTPVSLFVAAITVFWLVTVLMLRRSIKAGIQDAMKMNPTLANSNPTSESTTSR